MKIGIDIMGGDYAPQAVIDGAILARKELPGDVKLVLLGDKTKAETILQDKGFEPASFEFVHTSEVIEMGEHPAKAFARKPNSSIAVGFGMLDKGEIDGFASAGSTGAMLVGAMYTVKSIPGIIRPAIATAVPRPDLKPAILLDVGLNPDCKPDVLYQYGIFGSVYAENLLHIKNPRVGLLNIGSEEEKGNLLAKATHETMKDSRDFNFVGNIEANEIFATNKADVVVCDGFVGNIVLKQAEAFYTLIKKRKITDFFFDQFNFENYGGTPILGINAPVIIGHGVSNDIAIKNMILHTREVIQASLTDKFKEIFH
jgi:phosphate acyltransferase